MRHNRTNDSEVMTSEICRWPLEIPVWIEWNNFSTSGFGSNRSKICGNLECRSRREFCKLSKKGENSELRHWMKELGSVELGKNFKIWLQIGINFLSFFWFFRVCFVMQYGCMMSCNMSAVYIPYQKKKLPNIDGVRIVGGNSHSSPLLALTKRLMKKWLVYLQKSTIDMYNIYHHLSPKWHPCV
jgi:hypothetical protein